MGPANIAARSVIYPLGFCHASSRAPHTTEVVTTANETIAHKLSSVIGSANPKPLSGSPIPHRQFFRIKIGDDLHALSDSNIPNYKSKVTRVVKVHVSPSITSPVI